MKIVLSFLAGGALTGGALALPNVGYDECDVIDVKVETADPTFTEPDPAVTAMQIIEYCGQRVVSSGGVATNQPAFKVVDIDLETAQIIVAGAGDLLNNDDVFIGGAG